MSISDSVDEMVKRVLATHPVQLGDTSIIDGLKANNGNCPCMVKDVPCPCPSINKPPCHCGLFVPKKTK